MEALVFNFELTEKARPKSQRVIQYDLFDNQPQEACVSTTTY